MKFPSPKLRLPRLDDVEWIAGEYIRHGAVPEGYPEDAYHIAIAVINGVDCLLSWNFKHIVKEKNQRHSDDGKY